MLRNWFESFQEWEVVGFSDILADNDPDDKAITAHERTICI
jgi:hypothetical protein